MSFYTDMKSPAETKLAIVMTTYNREQQAVSAIHRIKSDLLDDPRYKNIIKLFVINNGDELPSLNKSGIRYINNRNLGGSGGFSRGLYEIEKDPTITHCLFMDDDAACEIEAIIKTYDRLANANDPNLAIAGSMVYEHKPWILHESGARMHYYDIGCKANKHGLDLRTKKGITDFHKPEPIDYGAWWFYAFNIRQTPYYPFPFFVRGDDILFGLMNLHHVKTDIDITSRQMCFLRKYTPWVIYLTLRSSFIHGSLRKKRLSPFFLLLYFNYHVLRYAMGYRYTMSLAIIEAFKDGNKGLPFWRKHIDCIEPMARIKALQPHEHYGKPFAHYSPEAFETITPIYKNTSKIRLQRILRIVTLNGHLIPDFFFKEKPYAISETLLSPIYYAFRRKKVLMINETTGKTMELKHSKRLFFGILLKMGWLSFKALFTLNKTMNHYKEGIPSFCTRDFWEEVFKEYGGLEPSDKADNNE